MRKRKLVRYRIAIGIIIMAVIIKLLDQYGSVDSPSVYPDYPMEILSEITDLENLYQKGADKESQKQIFLQTGLGKEGVKQLAIECSSLEEFKEKLEMYQKQLFYGTGNKQMIALNKGDVLVSMSQRLCYFPHGHAAIVIDKERILEAKSYVAGSCICKKDKWTKLSSFVVLRIKDEVLEKFQKTMGENPAYLAADYAKKNLNNLPYSLFKDIRYKEEKNPKYTQCAHLVWYAYYKVGLDVDENRGIIVKPKDFLKSDVFEVVQVFGINPEKVLNMRDE